jgi:hypothetical protein
MVDQNQKWLPKLGYYKLLLGIKKIKQKEA